MALYFTYLPRFSLMVDWHKFWTRVRLMDIINCAKFYRKRLGGLDSVRGRSLTIPIGLQCRHEHCVNYCSHCDTCCLNTTIGQALRQVNAGVNVNTAALGIDVIASSLLFKPHLISIWFSYHMFSSLRSCHPIVHVVSTITFRISLATTKRLVVSINQSINQTIL